jgi:hypothetical protein
MRPIEQSEIRRMTEVRIRRLDDSDAAAVYRLVQLDSADAPEGPLLGAEVEGRLVAVASIEGGEVVADPFSRTNELRALLELRAAQLRGREPRERRRFGGLFAGRQERAAVPTAPTPPGAGGSLVSQPR